MTGPSQPTDFIPIAYTFSNTRPKSAQIWPLGPSWRWRGTGPAILVLAQPRAPLELAKKEASKWGLMMFGSSRSLLAPWPEHSGAPQLIVTSPPSNKCSGSTSRKWRQRCVRERRVNCPTGCACSIPLSPFACSLCPQAKSGPIRARQNGRMGVTAHHGPCAVSPCHPTLSSNKHYGNSRSRLGTQALGSPCCHSGIPPHGPRCLVRLLQ